MANMKVDLPHLSEEPDRHGNIRLYVRRHGRRIRLRVGRGDDGFIEAYQDALGSLADLRPPSPLRASRRSLHAAPWAGWLHCISAPRNSRSLHQDRRDVP
jgi:hypothetical protein